jgi:hypothetical protein
MAGSRATAGYIYDPASGLYFKVTSAGNDSAVEFLSTNGVVNDAGNITATLIFGGHGVFPSEVSLQFNVIYQGTTISGPMAITFYDGSLDNLRFQMNLASSRTGVSVASDLTASPTSVTGTVSISKGAISLTLTNISYTPGKFASDYSFGSIQGTLSVLSDGSGQVTAIANGTFTLTWNAALDARFTAPGGATVDLGYLPTL